MHLPPSRISHAFARAQYRITTIWLLRGCSPTDASEGEILRRAAWIVSGREYKNMCLSLQSTRLRRDLHEKTKTCFRGVSPASPSRPHGFPRSSPLSSTAFTLAELRSFRGTSCATVYAKRRCREKLAQRNRARARDTLHFTIAKILCKASVYGQARSRTRIHIHARKYTTKHTCDTHVRAWVGRVSLVLNTFGICIA